MKGKVYISAYLGRAQHGYSVASGLKEKLGKFGYEVLEIDNHKKNEWCRDYMPVVTRENQLVQFKYAPGYMTDTTKWSERIPDHSKIHREHNLQCINAIDIKLDGGAIEIYGKQGIISDRVFRDNPGNEKDLIEKIQNYLSLDRIIVVPQYPYDFTGHVDGMVRFIDNETVLINDLSEEMKLLAEGEKEKKNIPRCKLIKNWYYSFLMTFHNAGLKTEILPSNYAKNESDKYGNGIYLNFLRLLDLIVMPSYNDKKFDDAAKNKLMVLYEREVITIDASKLAREGGMINCVTWTDHYVV
ncbi:MAG: agmatine deiminase family protein [Bacteroidales bacterium]